MKKISNSDKELLIKSSEAGENYEFELAHRYLKKVQNKESYWYLILSSFLSILNNKFLESFHFIKNILNNKYNHETIESIQDVIFLFLVKKQYHLVNKLFKEFPELKEQFKPIYYVVMRHLKDENPKEYLKMGSELEETVVEIEKEILDTREELLILQKKC